MHKPTVAPRCDALPEDQEIISIRAYSKLSSDAKKINRQNTADTVTTAVHFLSHVLGLHFAPCLVLTVFNTTENFGSLADRLY